MKQLKTIASILSVSLICGLSSNAYSDEPQEVNAAQVQISGPAITGAEAKTDTSAGITIDSSLPPLAIEKTGTVLTLPKSYPESWVLVDEASFFNMASGKVIVLDVAEQNPNKRIKGIMDKSYLGNFTQSKGRGEFYIMETFHERGTRGPKTDVLTIYDKTTLSIVNEIVWPKANRLQALPERYSIGLSSDEKFLYVSNFDPAASITVIDLDKKEIIEEISTAGCVLSYPVGKRSVASICSNGAMLSTQINNDGSFKSRSRTEPFFDTDETPVFEHPVYVNGIAHFPSFKGLLHSFDMRGKKVKYLGNWNMLSAEQQADNWRPSGLVLNDVDDSGLMYTIFQPNGHEGTHTHGGTQVWVFDLKKKERVKVIETPNWAISIAVTRGDNPLLVVTNGDLNLDVFDAKQGTHIQTVADFGNSTPLLVNKSY